MWALAKASAIVVQIKSEAIMAIAPLSSRSSTSEL